MGKKINLIILNLRSTFLNKEFLFNNKQMLLKSLAVFLIVILGLTTLIGNKSVNDEIEFEESSSAVSQSEEKVSKNESNIFVDIGGEVNNPIVAELPPNSRVDDAIDAAGGLTKKANIENLNRAAKLIDGEKIFVPSIEDKNSSGLKESNVKDNKININTGTVKELEEIPGVGPSTANKIIEYRDSNGRFENISDIKKIKGIGDKTYEKMKDIISI
ncbi:MAG: helix-hairpin-helix domain-containing protein [Anaerovoracaceae bacterium]